MTTKAIKRPRPMTEAQRTLVVKWMPYAYKIAGKIGRFNGDVNQEELDQEALHATCYAASLFDPKRSTSLGTLMGYTLPQRMLHAVCRQKAKGFSAAAYNMANKRAMFSDIPFVLDIDAPATESGVTPADSIPDRPAGGLHPDDSWDLQDALRFLTDREREMLLLRYKYDWTLAEIGRKIGYCKERTRFFLDEALRRLRWLLTEKEEA